MPVWSRFFSLNLYNSGWLKPISTILIPAILKFSRLSLSSDVEQWFISYPEIDSKFLHQIFHDFFMFFFHDFFQVPCLVRSIDFDTGNRFPLVPGAGDLQKPSKIHVKIRAPGGPRAPPPCLAAAFPIGITWVGFGRPVVRTRNTPRQGG